MKEISFQKMMAAAVLLATLGYVGAASAHTANGSLGAAAGAVDVYQTTCSKNAAGATANFMARVKAAKAGVLVSVQAIKDTKASQATDAAGGNAAYSPDGKIVGGGEGVYTILVNKSGAGAMNYVMEAHCNTASGGHSGQTEPKAVQNQ